MNKNSTWSQDLDEAILKGCQYSGSRAKGIKTFSASQLNASPLQNYLKMITEPKSKDSIGASELGTIFQLGIDEIFKDNPRYIVARRKELKLENGWTISGETDLIDLQEKVIIDFKVLSLGGFKNANKNLMYEGYNVNMAAYRLLNGEEYSTALSMFNKGGSAAKNNVYQHLELDLMSNEEVLQKFIDATNTIDEYLNSDKVPPECDNIWQYGKSNGKPSKCLLYCDYRDVCPAFSMPSQGTMDRNFINDLEPKKRKPKNPYAVETPVYDF